MNRLIVTLAFALAATSALAEPLEFSSAPGPALNIARALMGEERGTPLADDETLTVALVDLDGDGTRDIFAFADASYFCGTAGCIPRLYRLERDTGKWSELPIETGAFTNGDPSMWSVGDPDANGWRTLTFASSDMRLVLAWNGAAYSN